MERCSMRPWARSISAWKHPVASRSQWMVESNSWVSGAFSLTVMR